MSALEKKVGYLKGLLFALEQENAESSTGKLLEGVVDALNMLCDRVEEMDEMLAELNDYVESIDEDLLELEGNADDEDYDYEDDAASFGEDQLHLLRMDESEDEAMVGGVCSACDGIFFAFGDEQAKYICPHCKKKVTFIPLNDENTPVGEPADDE